MSAAAVSRGTERWTLQAIPPFRLDLTVWALRRRARNAVDRWDGTTYRRTICVDGRPIELAIAQPGSATAARVTVGATPAVRVRTRVDAVIRRLLGLNVDLTAWYRLAAADARLRPLADRFRGVKPPRFPSVFEAVVNAFACQQLSLEVGLELLNRLAARAAGAHHGGAALSAPSRGLPFPRPHDVARLRRSSIRALGFSTQKAHAILTLARALDRGTLDLESLGALDDEDACARLLDLRGVGRWTAEYVLLRGLGRLNVFPGDDVGAQKRLARWLGRRAALDYAGVRRATRSWEPYAGLVYFHLLLDGLAHAGVVRAA